MLKNLKISIPFKETEMKNTMDEMIKKPFVTLDNSEFNRHFGQIISPLTKRYSIPNKNKKITFVGLYRNIHLRETIGVMKIKPIKIKENNNARRWEYIFEYPTVKL